MEGQDEVSAREQHFHSQVRESTVRGDRGSPDSPARLPGPSVPAPGPLTSGPAPRASRPGLCRSPSPALPSPPSACPPLRSSFPCPLPLPRSSPDPAPAPRPRSCPSLSAGRAAVRAALRDPGGFLSGGMCGSRLGVWTAARPVRAPALRRPAR